MLESKKYYRVFVSAAEPSADTHCANLINTLNAQNKSIQFFGVGGPKMVHAGCELLDNTVDKAAMIYNALANVSYFHRLIKQIKHFFEKNEIDLVIVCDSPAFNFHVAKAAKKAGVKTLFYVAPQLWAWGRWRIGKLKKNCDKLCCILPFEQEWFASKDIDTIFVGNPLLDKLEIKDSQRNKIITQNLKLKAIAMMPGSREAEVKSLWQPMQKIALALKKKHSDLKYITVAVDSKRKKELQSSQIPGFECEYAIDSVYKIADSVDFTIVASGSATLEVAAAGCPMVIMYQSSMILWHLLGKWLIKTKHLSLVNILAGRELVPEFMPYFRSFEPIIETIDSLLNDSEKLEQISIALRKLVEPLAKKKAREEVAKTVMEMLNI